ncbi:MFS transporter [Kocuria rosea]|jgi:MFS family permease|uniref:MFS transporter n=1 Tax=Kocuria rosea TaxID=1275 RepID=UPI000D642703|nr:MFS transporter [Kocuria rosea]MCM3484634.1 MFS transporter [Kocuria rosea]MEB2526116.1 MFS transporter [Kocuria rosea]MEB2616827.1 MFS transporter [Kocuria rosea]PWF83976.1 MFS transporter [Kocuria rosea]QCY34453.1 MFS transporter [Kocuria rosea]
MDSVSIEPTAPPAPDTAGRAGRLPVVLLLAGSCMPVLGAVLLAPVLPSMTQAFAGTPGVEILVPVVLTVPALMIALFAPIAGAVADRVGRKTLLLIAMVLYSVFGTMPLWLDSLTAIVASRVGVGIAEAAIMTVCTTLITDYYTGKQRDKYLGMQVLVASLAATAFFALGGALGAQGWRVPFWLYASAALIAIPMALVLWEPVRSTRQAESTPVPWRQVAVPSLVTLFGGVVFYALIVQLPYVLTDLGVTDVAVIGAGTAVASLATATGAFGFRFVSGAGPARLLPVAFGLAAVGLGVLWFASSVPVALAGAVVTSAGTGLLLPTLLTWAVSGLRIEQRGRGTGIWTGSLYIGQFVSPIVLGVAAAALGGLPVALGVLGILAAVAAVAAAVGRPQRAVAAD